MRRILSAKSPFVTFALGMSLLLPTGAGAVVGTISGRESAFFRSSYVGPVPFTVPGVALGTATILRGKRNRNLVVDFTANYSNATDGLQPSWSVKVNGISVSPSTWVGAPCAAGGLCLDSGSWWIDLDSLEASNPKAIYNMPLEVVFAVTDSSGPHPSSALLLYQLAARLEKK